MSESYVRNVIEAALLAAGTPLPVAELTRLFEDSARPSPHQVRAALAALAAEYSGRGIELKETASGFRIQVRRELAAEISRLWPGGTGRCWSPWRLLPTASRSRAPRSRRCAASPSTPTSSGP